MSDYHTLHCLNCINLRLCCNNNNTNTNNNNNNKTSNQSDECQVISCPNKCDFKFHACKLNQHLVDTCPNETIDCINRNNGCKLRLKRFDLTYHLHRCAANVVRCSSFGMRMIKNRSSLAATLSGGGGGGELKWPDPIREQKRQLEENSLLVEERRRLEEFETTTINQVLLAQDYKSLKQFAKQYPLRFQRMYGYLIGLKLDNLNNTQQNKFLFMRYLLKNVKSKIFKDIESENCVVFNDELGCSACQIRIRMLELKRFSQMKEKYKQFDSILANVDTLAEFIEKRVYIEEKFLAVYNEIYATTAPTMDEVQVQTPENNKELYELLLKRNDELIEAIELDSTLKLNVAKELPCEIFQLQYETYRTKDTDFSTDCEQLVRRDEYNDHYRFYHNTLLPNYDFIETKCLFHDYGCRFFTRRIEFEYGSSTPLSPLSHSNDDCSSNKTAQLIFNDVTNAFVFSLDNDATTGRRQARNTNNDDDDDDGYHKINNKSSIENEKNSREESGSNAINLLDLPFEVLYEIITHLDSNCLFNLSITSKAMRNVCEQFLQLRGIVYPKWCKIEATDAKVSKDANNNNEKESLKKTNPKWHIEKYIYSFSKHIKTPNEVKMKTSLPSAYYNHIRICPYKVLRDEFPQRVKIFPPFN